ncbi:quinone oxidoreductase [Aeromicrobium sp. Leaf350]|uniref:quinone oxidoreductase family protein n=1 Tax=Aeromicrobium sp. Leaf350 TaxID=2876565 RepID=UPI001E52EDB6|nr:quinone oxidoreductase [Aeromicrobium sp. Leaf350]
MTRAIVIRAHGGPEEMRLEEIVVPDPGPDELLVEVAAAGVNYIDTYQRSGQYSTPLPFTLGKEASGRVLAVGAGVTGFAEGDTVAWGHGEAAYAEHAIVPTSQAVIVPDGVEPQVAAALMLQGMTAHYLVNSIVPFAEGDTVLVHAGAGGVGLLLTQLLKRHGVRVLTTAGSPEKAELSRGAGADEVLEYDGFGSAVRDLTEGRGVRAVLDGVGATTFDEGLDALQPRGTFVLFGAASGNVPPVDPRALNTKGSLVLTRPSLAHFIADRAELEWRAADVFAAVADGGLDVRIGGTYPLADAVTAHEDLEGRRTTGKLLLLP